MSLTYPNYDTWYLNTKVIPTPPCNMDSIIDIKQLCKSNLEYSKRTIQSYVLYQGLPHPELKECHPAFINSPHYKN